VNIIGLGQAGCNIADKFSEHPQYNIYKVDAGQGSDFDFVEESDNPVNKIKSYNIEKCVGPEEYERNYSSMKSFFKDMSGDTLFILGGSGHVSAIALRIIQEIKAQCEVDILYIRPDFLLLSESKRLHEKVTYNVLQQYTRSGSIRRMYLVSNPELENILGDVPILGYHDKLNELIVSTLHMINVYKNTEPVMGGLPSLIKNSTRRICTVGIFDIKKSEEKLFFPLDTVREMGYIYSIRKDRLQTESGLHKQITSQMKEKLSSENLSVSFGVFPTDYNSDYGYILAYSPNIQS
tara:strand:- start:182 stop:1060 length:879 start_codon:yes stop_codon:yes gene_type:complete